MCVFVCVFVSVCVCLSVCVYVGACLCVIRILVVFVLDGLSRVSMAAMFVYIPYQARRQEPTLRGV